jgi:hypothetical protein
MQPTLCPCSRCAFLHHTSLLCLPCSARAVPDISRPWSPALWLPPMSASCESNAHLPAAWAMAACLGQQGQQGDDDRLMQAAFLEYMMDVRWPLLCRCTLRPNSKDLSHAVLVLSSRVTCPSLQLQQPPHSLFAPQAAHVLDRAKVCMGDSVVRRLFPHQ